MRRPRVIALSLLSLAGALLAAAALRAGAAEPEARVVRALAYGAPVADDADAHTLDLHLPARGSARPPLLVFVAGHFWRDRGGERSLDPHFARVLQAAGAAVAMVRHRLAPAHRHPAAAEDVAAATAFLLARADRLGFDPQRVFLGGYASGAQLAALVALDPAYLAAHGADPARLAGVLGISGVYDLDPDPAPTPEELAAYEQAFGDASVRRAASPQRLVVQPGPPVLLLASEQDIPGYVRASLAFADALRAQGREPAEAFLVMGRSHVSALDLSDERNAARTHVLSFLRIGAGGEDIRELFAARARWRDPPLSSEGFWQAGARVRAYDADARFTHVANLPFQQPGKRTSRPVRPRRYHAVGLFDFLAAQGGERAGQGAWLTLTNARGEQAVFRLDELRGREPRIVIGIDDERNPFRIVDLYQRLRERSGSEPEAGPLSLAHPLGGFLLFPEAEPEALGAPVFGRYQLTAESFRLTPGDPLAPLRDLPPDLLATLTREPACLACHQLRGVGGRAGHLRANDATLVGGFGLPLEEYPPAVWRRFVFEQKQVAAELGATPVSLPGASAQRLYDLVERERDARARPSGGE
jgi:acetyl esterase/lipase